MGVSNNSHAPAQRADSHGTVVSPDTGTPAVSYPQRTVIAEDPTTPGRATSSAKPAGTGAQLAPATSKAPDTYTPPNRSSSYLAAQRPSGGLRSAAPQNTGTALAASQQQSNSSTMPPYVSAAASSSAASARPKRKTPTIFVLSLLLMLLGAGLVGAYFIGILPSYDGTAVSESSVISDSQAHSVVIKPDTSASDKPSYPVVEIQGISLPEEYGDGYMNPDAAFYIINQYRVNNGLPELGRVDEPTMQAAIIRLREISTEFSHTRPDGSRFATVFAETGVIYSYASENLAEGQFTAGHAVLAWMKSESHNANLLDPNITHAAIVCGANENNMPVWVFLGIRYAG